MQMPPKSSSQQLSPSPCVTKQGDQPQDPVLQNKETNLKIHVQRTLFDNVSRDIEGEKEGDSKRRKTGRQAEGGSDMHTEHAHDGVGHKLLHQVLARTTHGHQNQRQVSARRTTSTDPYSVPQASEAQMNVLQVKEQEVKQTAIRQFSLEGNEHMTTTRSRQLVEVAQSQIPTFLPQERSQPR
jgi:hypothetical protein